MCFLFFIIHKIILHSIYSLTSFLEKIPIKHIFWEANFVIDAIADRSHVVNDFRVWFNVLPREALYASQFDSFSESYYRSFSLQFSFLSKKKWNKRPTQLQLEVMPWIIYKFGYGSFVYLVVWLFYHGLLPGLFLVICFDIVTHIDFYLSRTVNFFKFIFSIYSIRQLKIETNVWQIKIGVWILLFF